MVILDLSIVNVALPSIQSSLGFSSPDLQWVVDAYVITFAGFLMLGGRAADHFGQRRTFVAALVLFALASLAGGAAPDQEVLVAARAVQGLAGALMAACSLAIITASFPPGPKLHRAIGIWAAMNGLGGAAGVLLGGIITEVLSWRWVLLINPPIGIAAALVAYAVVSERRRARDGASFDLAGALTLTIGQMVLVYGVVRSRACRLGLLCRTRPDRDRGRPARGVHRDRDAPGVRAARPLQGVAQAAEDRQHDRAAVQRGAVPDVVRELSLHAAGAGAVAATRGLDLPADDVDDHARRLARRQAREPVRRALGARRRTDHADRRDAAVHEDRIERQRRSCT